MKEGLLDQNCAKGDVVEINLLEVSTMHGWRLLFPGLLSFGFTPFSAMATESPSGNYDDALTLAWTARLVERASLTLVIIALALVLLVAFWRGLQRVNFSVQSEGLTTGANIVLATPIFVLLILVGYAYVTYSFPLEIRLGAETTPVGKTERRGRFINLPPDELKPEDVGAAIASLQYLRKTSQFVIPIPTNAAKFDAALDTLVGLRDDWVIEIEGAEAPKLWAEKGETYVLNPGLLGQKDRAKLEKLAPWYLPNGED